MSHAFQVLKNPPEYTIQHSVQPGRNTKNEAHAHLLGMHDSSMSFTPILPKPSHHTQSVCLGTQLTLPKSMGNNTIFLFQKV